MDRLIEYFTHHPYLVGAAVLALVVVITYESRMQSAAFARSHPRISSGS
jgi:hypothetical protein